MIQIRPREGSKSRTFCRIYFRAEGGGRLEERGREPEGRSESYCREIVIVNLARQAGGQAGQQRGAAAAAAAAPHSLTKEPAYSSILSPHACLVKSLCQQQLHPAEAMAVRGCVSRRPSPRNLGGKGLLARPRPLVNLLCS